MNKASSNDSLFLFSSDSIIISHHSTIKPIHERAKNEFEEEKYSNESLLSGKDKIETITESEEENNSIEDSQRHSSLSSLKNDVKMAHGRWTSKEHHLFLEGLIIYGNEWKMVQKHIQTRSSTQARSHAQKFFIKIRKIIMNETDQQTIRNIIHEIFKREMKEHFCPPNLSVFLDKMATLVFAADNGPQKTLLPTYQYKSTSHESNNTQPTRILNNNKERAMGKEKEKEPMVSFIRINQMTTAANLMKKKKKQLLIRKEQYFNIKKDKSKLQFKSTGVTLPDKESIINSNKSNYENSSQMTHYTSPSNINYVSIAMDDNSENTYIYNLNSDQHLMNLKRNSNTTNPFNLQFEEMLNRSTSNNNYYGNNDNNNIINKPNDEKQYDNYSYSSFEL